MFPAVGDRSPAIGNMFPAVGDISPVVGNISPAVGDISPAIGNRSPGIGEDSPTAGRGSPAIGEGSPAAGKPAGDLWKPPVPFIMYGGCSMTRKRDYIPRHDPDFDLWFTFLNQYTAQKCTGSPPEWPHIPQAARTAMAEAYAAWYTAFAKTLGPHSPVDTGGKNSAKKAAAAVIRPFVNQYLRFPPVTGEDRTALGIPNHDRIRTPIPVPPEGPELELAVKGIRQIHVHFWEKGSGGKARPYGYDGAVVYWLVRSEAPSRPEELIASTLATRTPSILEFDETQRGSRVHVALRWQNEKGELGPFSEIHSAIIP